MTAVLFDGDEVFWALPDRERDERDVVWHCGDEPRMRTPALFKGLHMGRSCSVHPERLATAPEGACWCGWWTSGSGSRRSFRSGFSGLDLKRVAVSLTPCQDARGIWLFNWHLRIRLHFVTWHDDRARTVHS